MKGTKVMWKALLLGLSLLSAPAWAQSTPAQITDEINNLLPSGRSSISAEVLRQVLLGMNASYIPITGGAGLTLPTLTIGTAQSSIGQISQATAAYPGVNVCSDLTRIQVGGITPSLELCQGSSTSVSAMSASIEIPPGSFSGLATWPDTAGSFYVVNGNATKSGVALYALAGLEGVGRQSGGTNQSTVNCKLFDPSCAFDGGQDVSTQYASESDVNFYTKAGGVAPSGTAVAGFASILNANAVPSGGSISAYIVSAVLGAGHVPWQVGFATNTGTATIGMSLGATSASPISNSQTINLTAIKADSSTALGQIFEDTLGRLTLASPGGINIATAITLTSLPTSGTATGSLCVTSSNTVFIKTTSGACL